MSTTELVTLKQVAIRTGRSPSAVSNWRNRYDDFPDPNEPDGQLFDWQAIDSWGRNRIRNWERAPRRQRPADGGVWSLVDRFRGSAAPWDILTPLLAAITIHHLDPECGADELVKTGQALEQAHHLSEGALTQPFTQQPGSDTEFQAETMRWIEEQREAGETATDLFEAALKQAMMSMGRAGGEFSTPQKLQDFLVGLLPKSAQTILDPACGMGGLLCAAASRNGTQRVAGHEVNPSAQRIAQQRMVVHGLPAAVDRDDWFACLAQQPLVDAIITTPPFGLRPDPGSPLDIYLQSHDLKRLDADSAWLLASSQALSDTGRAVVLTTSGPTFSGPGRVRHELVRSGSLEAVIALPAGLLDNTGVALTAWVLRSPTSRPEAVLFIDANEPDRSNAQRLRRATEQFQLWEQNPTTYQPVDGYSATVPVLDLLTEDVPLVPGKWAEKKTDPASAATQATASLDALNKAMQQIPALPAVTFDSGPPPEIVGLDILEAQGLLSLHRGRNVGPSKDLLDAGEHPVITGAQGADLHVRGYLSDLPKHAYVTQPGDLVVSLIGPRIIIDQQGGNVLGSSSLLAIHPMSDDPLVNPQLLRHLLMSPRISKEATGVTIERVAPRNLTLPRINAEQARALTSLLTTLDTVTAQTDALSKASQDAIAALITTTEVGAAITEDSK